MSVRDILIDGKISSQYYDGSTFPNVDIDQVTGLQAALTVITDDIADINNSVGQPDGICPLNAMGLIDPTYLDPSVFTFEGTWDALTNTPTLTNGVGNIGDMYIVSVGGVRFGETFIAGDYCVYVNGLWEKIASGSNSVTSVSAGSNVSIGGTAQNPIVNVVTSPAFTQVSSSAPVPVSSGDLTRKDYVDNFINNASNLGFANGDVFKQKSGNTLQFRRLNTNGTVSITTNIINDTVDIETDKSLIGLSNVSNEKNNFTAILPPTSANDGTQGYSIASRWIDTNLDKEYVCMNATTGAAVWVETTQQSAGEVNTASNVGAGAGVFKTKVGTDLQFKSLVQTTNQVLIASGTDTLTLSTPQDIHSTANMNLSSVTLSQAAGNAVNVTGTNGVIKLTGINSSVENTGIIGSMDRVNITNVRYFYWNNTNGAAMNIFYDASAKYINISNLGGGNSENIYMAVAHNRALFPFAAHVNYRADMTQSRIACFWQINGTQSVSNFRFGLMGDVVFDNYAGEIGPTTNSRGIYNAGNNRNSITFEFLNGSAQRHQNDDVAFTTFAGAHYGANFDNGDIIIMVSSFDNPPTMRLHAYNFAAGVATWKNSYSFVLRSNSMIGGDCHTKGYPYLNCRNVGANANLIGQRWIQNNVTSWVNGVGTFDPLQTVSYYY